MRCLKSDYNVLCLTNREWGGKESYIVDGIPYFTITPRFVTRLNERVRTSVDGTLKQHVLKLLFFGINKLKLIISVFTWPWLSPKYTNRFYEKMENLYDMYCIDCVVPVYKQIDPLIAAKRLKRKLNKAGKDIQVIPYFLDPLSGGIGPKMFSEEMMVKRGQEWEKRVLDVADTVIVMESSRTNHEKNNKDQAYYDKLVYMDIPLLNLESIDQENCIATNENRKVDVNLASEKGTEDIRVFYGGTLHEPMRNVTRMIALISRVKNPRIHFVFAGYGARQEIFANKKNIEFLGELSHEKVREQLNEADVLLNMGVTRSTAISGKIFEYMTTGKPIVSTFSIDKEACIPYLNKYPLAFMVDEREQDLDKQATELESFIIENLMKTVPREYIRETFKKNMPETTAEYLRKAMEEYGV